MDTRTLFLCLYFALLPTTVLLVSIALGFHRAGMKRSARRCAMLFACSLTALVLLMTFCAPVAAEELTVTPTPTKSKAALIHEHILLGERQCGAVAMIIPIDETIPGKRRITVRPIALCAHDEIDDTWHVIMLHLQYPVAKEYLDCIKSAQTPNDRSRCILPFYVVTPGYEVEHLAGYGATRFIVNAYRVVSYREEGGATVTARHKLIVYRTRHVWFDDAALESGDAERVITSALPIDYTPYHPDFADSELVAEGEHFLLERVMHAKDALRTIGVMSHAFQGKLLADVIPWQIPMALAAIEQTDDAEFAVNARASIDKVFIDYALNGPDAYRFSRSHAGAIGPYQFTDTNGAGTYSGIVRNYRVAELDGNFESGARDLDNVIKAAICLIDQEVAGFPSIRALFLKEPILAGIYPVAAYNGGHERAKELYGLMKTKKIALARVDLVPRSVITSKKDRTSKKKRTVIRLNGETYGYVKKYGFLISEYLGDLEP